MEDAMSVHRALVVEDNMDLAGLMCHHLEDIDLSPDIASDGFQAMDLFKTHAYEVVLLDVMLPGIDGFEVCRRIRRNDGSTPIMMLTARSEEIDKVFGFDLGADDYLTKPFGVAEFRARVKALLRRARPSDPSEESRESIACGDIEIDTRSRCVTLGGAIIDLTAKEFELLIHFIRHPERVFSRSELLTDVWGYANNVYQHTVNSHINRLRAKIETDPANPSRIVTVWGVGYRFAPHPG